jgi:hypothetical protein
MSPCVSGRQGPVIEDVVPELGCAAAVYLGDLSFRVNDPNSSACVSLCNRYYFIGVIWSGINP